MDWSIDNIGLIPLVVAIVSVMIALPWGKLTSWIDLRFRNVFWIFAVLFSIPAIFFLFSDAKGYQFDPFATFATLITAALTLLLLFRQNRIQDQLLQIETETHTPYVQFSSEKKDSATIKNTSNVGARILLWLVRSKDDVYTVSDMSVLPRGRSVASTPHVDAWPKIEDGETVSSLVFYRGMIDRRIQDTVMSFCYQNGQYARVETTDSTPIDNSQLEQIENLIENAPDLDMEKVTTILKL